MAGRGRGRGRGKESTTSSPPRPGATNLNGQTISTKQEPPLVTSKAFEFDDLKKIILSLDVNSKDALDDFAKKAQTFGDSDEKCFQLIDFLYDKTFEDNEFGRKAAIIMNSLALLEEKGVQFRSSLLKRAQEHYKNREALRARSLSQLTGLVHVICEIFKELRIGGSPLKPLASSIYQLFDELLQGVRDDIDDQDVEGCQSDCFYSQFKNIGQMLESIDQEKMDNMMCQVRDTIVCSSCTQQARCLLTEILELKASNWHLSQAVQNFYADAMADIMASHG